MTAIADGYDAFLFDLDGVLFRGSEPIEGAAETVDALRRAGKGLAFVTNNSARTPEAVVAHLAGVGVSAEPGEVETSALATAALLRDRGVRTAFVIGEDGLRSALQAEGIELPDGEPETADAVVVGWDRAADYAKLRLAGILVQRGAALVASNADASYPAPDGSAWPGAGAIVAAIETTTGAKAEVVGKPHAPVLLGALGRTGGGRPLLIGDRLDTDIAGAGALGWDSVLVLTGISTEQEARASEHRPTYVLQSVVGLLLPR